MLLTCCRQINEQNTINGDTALHTAVRDIRDPDMVRLLIGFDIDPNIMNRQFHTPLRIAVEQRSYSIMDLLSKYSLDLDVAARESSVSDESDHERVGSMTEHAVLRQAVSILNVGSPHLLSYPGSRSQSPRSQSPRSRSASCRSASGYLSEEEYGKLTMEEKMDEDAKHTITKVNLKNKNPFSKVRVTKQEGRGVKELMRDLEQLPELDGFLLKQTSKPPYSYRKRWVHVTEEWVLWNDRQIGIDFTNDQVTCLIIYMVQSPVCVLLFLSGTDPRGQTKVQWSCAFEECCGCHQDGQEWQEVYCQSTIQERG